MPDPKNARCYSQWAYDEEHNVHVLVLQLSARKVLGKQVFDRLPVTDAVRPAVDVANLPIRGDPERVINGRQQVLRRHRLLLGVGGVSVTAPVDLTATDAAAGQQHRLASAPVVPAPVGINPRG